MAAPTDSNATSDLTPEGGGTRKLRLDEMVAERERAPLPPAPVLTLQPVAVDAAPVGAGRRGALKRLAEVEALARNNLRAAEEAQRLMQAERQLLEEEASARTKAEHTAAALRRELERLRATEEQRAAQARLAATHQARNELQTEMERVHDEHARVVDELDRMRGTLFDHDSLLDEYSQRLHEEQEAQARARAELARAEETARVAERNLEIATETARRRAEEDHARLAKIEAELRDTLAERDRANTELSSLTTGDGEVARLRRQIEATNEDTTRLLADLDVQAARADKAESELAASRDACKEAERIANAATEERDLLGISLETTRSELAERNESLDAERTNGQGRIADLTAQLSTTTRTAESATARAADLEARLEEAVRTRDIARSQVEVLGDQLERAVADAEHLRTHSASIGDELAAAHIAAEQARAEAEDVRAEMVELRAELSGVRFDLKEARGPGGRSSEAARPPDDMVSAPAQPAPNEVNLDVPVAAGPTAEAPGGEPDDAPPAVDPDLASALGEVLDSPKVKWSAGKAAGATEFRTVKSKTPRARAGGPIVEREAELIRQIAPVDPDPAVAEDEPQTDDTDAVKPDETHAEPPAWRRTAMAELTALAATDSDDLTPRRRR